MAKKALQPERLFEFDFIGERGTRYAVYEINSPTDRSLVNRVINKLYKPGVVFLPSPKQIEYFDSIIPFLLFGGGRGGGKTAGDIWKGIFRCHLVPGSQVLILRRTMPQLKKTILREFMKIPHVNGYSDIYQSFNISEMRVDFGNGSVLWFGSADNEKKWRDYLGGNYDLIIFDELSEFTYEMFQGLSGSCRTTEEKDVFGYPTIAQVCGTTNPGGIGGEFVKSLWIDKKPVPGDEESQYDPADYHFIQSLIDDNPYYAKGSKAREDYMKKLMKMPKKVRDAWIYGLWTGHEGMYFDTFERKLTLINKSELDILSRKQYWQPIWISIDWGKVHACVVQWHKYLDIMGSDGSKLKVPVTYREKEWHSIGESAIAEEIATITEDNSEVEKVVKIYLSPELGADEPFARARRLSSVFRSHKLPGTQPAFDSRVEGWLFLHSLLSARHRLGTKDLCGWLISEDCPKLLDALPMLSHHPKIDGDVLKTDSLSDDMGDCARYGIASHVKEAKVPYEERLQEALEGVDNVNHKAMIHRKMDEEEKRIRKPFILNKNIRRRPRR